MRRLRGYRTLGLWLACLAGAALTSAGYGQAFNVDMDIFFGSPQGGNGAPSSSFGAAANQPGFWNRSPGSGLRVLRGLDGYTTSASFEVLSREGGWDTLGWENPINTGDYALLLNDGNPVGELLRGNVLTYIFSGLQAGTYKIFTYAVHPQGEASPTVVFVPDSIGEQYQTVTGPMPGNSFAYLVTHSIHEVILSSGADITIILDQPPNRPISYFVNGFQIVPVPEPKTDFFLAFALFALTWRLRRRYCRLRIIDS